MTKQEMAETIRNMMTAWCDARDKWIELNGNDNGFAEWFTAQCGGHCLFSAPPATSALDENAAYLKSVLQGAEAWDANHCNDMVVVTKKVLIEKRDRAIATDQLITAVGENARLMEAIGRDD